MNERAFDEVSSTQQLKDGGYLTVTGLSKALGVSRMTLYRHIEAGSLVPDVTRLTGQQWFSPDTLARYRNSLATMKAGG